MILKPVKKKKQEIMIFQLNDKNETYEQLELEENVKPFELLNSDFIMLFIAKNKAWIWQGNNCSIRMRFISVYLIQIIKEKTGITRIIAIEQGDETNEFKNLVGIPKDSKPEFKLPIDSECIRENKKCPVLIRIDQKEEEITRLTRELDIATRHSESLSKIISQKKLEIAGLKTLDSSDFIQLIKFWDSFLLKNKQLIGPLLKK
jgi:hypothetical protein